MLSLGVGSAAVPLIALLQKLGLGFGVQFAGLAIASAGIFVAAWFLPRAKVKQGMPSRDHGQQVELVDVDLADDVIGLAQVQRRGDGQEPPGKKDAGGCQAQQKASDGDKEQAPDE